MKARDLLLLGSLLPLALVATFLHAREVLRSGLAEPVFYVSAPESAADYPDITGFRLDLLAPPSELRLGDRLLRVGGVDVRGRGHFGVDAVALSEAGRDGRLDLVYERDGVVHETVTALGRAALPWSRLPALIVMLPVCVIVLVRSRSGSPARFFFAASVAMVIFQAQFHGPSAWQTFASKSLFYSLGAVVPSLIVLWALHFPPEVPRPSRAVTALPWLLVPMFAIPRLSYLFGGPMPPVIVPVAINAAHLAFGVAFLAAATWNYRRSQPVGRRRIKWVLLCFWIGMIPMVCNTLFVFTDFGRGWYAETAPWTKIAFAAFPIGVLMSMSRQSLFDVDRVLGATATYTMLLVVMAIGILAIVPPTAAAASDLFGVAPASAQLALSVALVVGLLPLQAILRPRIDRALFPERFLAQTFATELLADLATATGGDDDQLLTDTGERLARGFGASSGAVYARRGATYDRIWTSASVAAAGPDRFDAADPLIAVIGAQMSPIFAGGRRRRALEALAPLQRATLETLHAELVVPLRSPAGMEGFLSLGARRSGDIYTATDAMLLASVALQIALRIEYTKGRSLGHYVPEAVRASIEGRSGVGLASRERMVSVLFVDLRGYSARAAESQPGDVFEVLSRYTTRVSEIVRQFGGQVVEFHGDGLMAVFGAPERHAEKERSAVLAAREIVDAVQALDPGRLGDARAALEVGVGVATGPAFVGNIRAIDRWIWSAIGSTTNLAARLQALTRELGTSIAIDDATYAGAGDAVAGFSTRPSTQIRGLVAPVTVHVTGVV